MLISDLKQCSYIFRQSHSRFCSSSKLVFIVYSKAMCVCVFVLRFKEILPQNIQIKYKIKMKIYDKMQKPEFSNVRYKA
jgi:hypothetical protein